MAKKRKRLNHFEDKFINELLLGRTYVEAYKGAGYSTKGWSQKNLERAGLRKVNEPKIQEELAKRKAQRQKRVNFDADKLLTTLSEYVEADPIDIYDLENRCFKPLEQWPPVWRKMLTAIDNKELFDGKGKSATKVGDIVKIKFIDKMRAIENIGKHVDVNAFKEMVEHNHKVELKDDELDARIAELEKRLKA